MKNRRLSMIRPGGGFLPSYRQLWGCAAGLTIMELHFS